jgi:hypothetical protein
MTNQEQVELDRIKAAALNLGEHFDTVHIFCTRHKSETEEDTGTVNASYGIGNWFARLGHIRDWIIRQDEFTRINCRKDE